MKIPHTNGMHFIKMKQNTAWNILLKLPARKYHLRESFEIIAVAKAWWKEWGGIDGVCVRLISPINLRKFSASRSTRLLSLIACSLLMIMLICTETGTGCLHSEPSLYLGCKGRCSAINLLWQDMRAEHTLSWCRQRRRMTCPGLITIVIGGLRLWRTVVTV